MTYEIEQPSVDRRRNTMNVPSATEPNSLRQMLYELWRHISPRRRVQLIALSGLMLLAMAAELVSIGAILPFLGALSAPEKVLFDPRLEMLIQSFGLTTPSQLILPVTALFCFTVVVAAITRIAFLWAQTRLTFSIGADLGIDVYRRTLYQPYAVHVSRNSSEVISGIMNKVGSLVFIVIQPVINLISASLILVGVMCLLLFIEPLISSITFLGFAAIYLFVSRLTKQQLLRDGQLITREQNRLLKALQEGLGGIRDVLIGGNQEVFLQIFRDADIKLRRSSGNIAIIGGAPRFVIEALAIVLLALMAFLMAHQHGGVEALIPVLGALALGAQRMLPLLQQVYHSVTSLRGGKAVFADALALLSQAMPAKHPSLEVEPLPFQSGIACRNIQFSYSDDAPLVLRGIDLDIPRGTRLGLVGVTGSGKSTLIDILLGLIPPTHGSLLVDGRVIDETRRRAWQRHIAHVPQSIFLADASVAENIAFGLPRDKVDMQRVRLAAQRAQIASVIECWRDGYQTLVGERGIRLSGGQRQRIGIARALYQNADVIVLDEATSALDLETEEAVITAINTLERGVTLIVIAHRISTLRDCDKIIELRNGVIAKSGTYAALYGG